MPAKLDNNAKEYQIDEVGMLLYDLAIGNQTSFGIDGSGASFSIATLYKNFGYSKNIKKISASDKAAFFNTIKSQIDAKLPMFLSLPPASTGGGGHAVVVDQYSDDSLGKFIHVNFGWAGAFDGYMNIETNPDIGGLSLTSHQMNLYYNIKPCSTEANDCYDSQTLESLDSFNGTDFIGQIDNVSDEDEFDIFLSGETAITPQVYQDSYPAYFVNLYDSQRKLLASFDDTYISNFQADKYKVILSKSNHIDNSYYDYNESNPDGYNIILQTQNISQEQKDTIESSLKKAPLFFDNLKPLSIKLGETKTITVNAATNNDVTTIVPNTQNDTIISLSSDENLIHITGKATGFVNLDINASSNGKTTVKSIPILVLDSDVVIGKNGVVSGAFSETNLSKVVEFQVLLDGQCSIQGDRGFSNGAGFFIGIDEAPSTDINISKVFNQGIYTIKASLESESSYYHIDDYPNFTISIDCDKVEESSEYLASAFDFTKVATTQLALKGGWNLVALPIDTTLDMNSFESKFGADAIIWRYNKDNTNQWSVYAKEVIIPSTVDSLLTLKSAEGFWIKIPSDINKTIVFDSNDTYDITTKVDINSLSSGWHLLGTGATKTVNELQSSNPNISLMWKYLNGAWQTTYDGTLPSDITKMEDVKAGEGVWVLVNQPNPTQNPTFVSENSIKKYTFQNSTELWDKPYAGAATVEHSTSISKSDGGSILVKDRAATYIGAMVDITHLLVADKLYVIRGFVKQPNLTNDTYILNAKISSSTPIYKELSRIYVDDTNWNRFKTFVSFTQEEIDAGVQIYINSQNYTYDYYLDDVEIATTSYVAPTSSSDALLRIASNKIVDKTNTPTRMKGINIIAYSDDQTIKAEKFANYTYFNIDKHDMFTIKEMGFNSIRISLWYKYFEDDTNPNVYKSFGTQWLDTVIGWAKEAGLYVMLDMHAPQGGGFQGPASANVFWTDASYKTRFINLWKFLADRYKNEPTIYAYDILNEPSPPTEEEYRTLVYDTVSGIREVDPNHIINVEVSFAQNGNGAGEPFVLNGFDNLMYDFHFYDPWNSFTDNDTAIYGTNSLTKQYVTSLFEDISDFYTTNNLPFTVSEFGQKYDTFSQKNSLAWVGDVVDILDNKGGSYFYFSYKGNEFSLYQNLNKYSENIPVNQSLKDFFKE
jgi:aryl-phospho-beta-D-glucosidase BglC (GH1 family)